VYQRIVIVVRDASANRAWSNSQLADQITMPSASVALA
jgi:hypothetical protein